MDGVRGLGIEVSATWGMRRRSPGRRRRMGFGRGEVRGNGDEVLGTSDRNESKRPIPRHGLN
jgi:hypothetical protein